MNTEAHDAAVINDLKQEIKERDALIGEMLEVAHLFERSLVYQMKVDRAMGDHEGANMKDPTLATVRAAIAKAEGRS